MIVKPMTTEITVLFTTQAIIFLGIEKKYSGK